MYEVKLHSNYILQYSHIHTIIVSFIMYLELLITHYTSPYMNIVEGFFFEFIKLITVCNKPDVRALDS